jgi:membrane protease YdiL (CAAX protease family)
MNIKRLFWNAEEYRLRLFFRLIAVCIIIGLLALVGILLTSVIIYLLSLAGMSDVTYALTSNVLSILVSALLFIGGPAIAVRWIDRRSKVSFGFSFTSQWWRDLSFGLILGALLMSIIYLIEKSFGWISINGFFRQEGGDYPFLIGFFIVLFQFLMVGIYEETLFRGYLLPNLSEGLAFIKNQKVGFFVAYLLSSGIFGLLHALNPNSSFISTFNIILAGLFLGLGFVLTGNLAISIGLHITWNFFQGNIYGFPVSGYRDVISIIDSVQSGQPLITGGNFGPEAGLIGIFAMLLGSALILVWVKNQYGELKLHILDNLFQAPSFPEVFAPATEENQNI